MDAQSSLHTYEIRVDAGEGSGVDVSLYNAATGERYWDPYTVTNTSTGGADLGFDTHGPLAGPVTSSTSDGVTTVIVPAVSWHGRCPATGRPGGTPSRGASAASRGRRRRWRTGGRGR
ncbi:MAG TPA: hypothetical protein VF576_14125 [Rubricoccaceae bacterium]